MSVNGSSVDRTVSPAVALLWTRPGKARIAPREALQRKLLDGLRYLLKEEFKLNQPQASDGWLTQDALWLVSKTASDKLRAHLLAHGIEGIPSSNTAVFDVLQDHGMLQPTPDGKAIWRATIASEGGWSHSFTLLRLAPALISRVRQLRAQVLVFARAHVQKCHYNSANCSGAAGFSIPKA